MLPGLANQSKVENVFAMVKLEDFFTNVIQSMKICHDFNLKRKFINGNSNPSYRLLAFLDGTNFISLSDFLFR